MNISLLGIHRFISSPRKANLSCWHLLLFLHSHLVASLKDILYQMPRFYYKNFMPTGRLLPRFLGWSGENLVSIHRMGWEELRCSPSLLKNHGTLLELPLYLLALGNQCSFYSFIAPLSRRCGSFYQASLLSGPRGEVLQKFSACLDSPKVILGSLGHVVRWKSLDN